MEKPILMLKDEFTRSIYDHIQTSGLPLVIIEPILRDVHMDIARALQEEYKKQVQEYNAHLEAEHASTEE